MDNGLRPSAHRDSRTPRRLQPLYAALALLLAGFAQAGQIYKSVGPDGKITYSDRPPPGANEATDVTRSVHDQDPSLKADPVKAALNVYTKEIIVESVARFCTQQAPQFAQRVQTAHDEWMQRHAILRQQKIVVLHDKLSNSELVALARQMEQENEKVLRLIQQASVEQRQKFCADAPKKFIASEFDLAGNRELVDVLTHYKVKPKG